jgi:hypothetical protein
MSREIGEKNIIEAQELKMYNREGDFAEME